MKNTSHYPLLQSVEASRQRVKCADDVTSCRVLMGFLAFDLGTQNAVKHKILLNSFSSIEFQTKITIHDSRMHPMNTMRVNLKTKQVYI